MAVREFDLVGNEDRAAAFVTQNVSWRRAGGVLSLDPTGPKYSGSPVQRIAFDFPW